MENESNLYLKIINGQLEKFDYKCVYCKTHLDRNNAILDNFYPRSKFPKLEFEKGNIVPVCSFCNMRKGSISPVDDNNDEIIINPFEDNFEEHIKLNEDGFYKPLTEKGRNTINLFELNRKNLIYERIQKTIKDLSEEQSYSSFEAIVHNHGPYKMFLNNQRKIESILDEIAFVNSNNKQYLNNMLFANSITILETYLSDTFINTVLSDSKYIRKFTETFHDFNEESLKLNEVYRTFENIGTKVSKAMLEIIYHNIFKVKGMYKDTLNIEFPKDLKKIAKDISVRHDVVHRNGRQKDSKEHMISESDIKDTINEISNLVEFIQAQIDQLNLTNS